jgi:heterodisulfide reductase subunit D
MNVELIFWASQTILLLVFIVGMVNVYIYWRKGVRNSKFMPSRGWLRILVSWVYESWFNRRLFRTSIWRWASHFLLLNGFVLLMALSAFSVLFGKIFPLFSGLDPERIKEFIDRDQPLKAFLNETGSLMMTIGWLFYAIRRYLFNPSQLRTNMRDHIPIIGLGLILSTGWFLEAIRINADQSITPFSYIGGPLASIISGLNVNWAGSFKSFYLFHGLLATLVLATIPYTKWMHTIAAGITTGFYSSRSQPIFPALPYTLQQRIELEACTRCGECIPWCPTYQEKTTNQAITPLKKIEFKHEVEAKLNGFFGWGSQNIVESRWLEHSSGVFDCTLCGQCEVVCPVHIKTKDLWLSMRTELNDTDRVPLAIQRLNIDLSRTHNLAGDDLNDRLAWSQNLEKPIQFVDTELPVEIVYFVGCVSSQYPQTFSIPQSIVIILEKLGVKYRILGNEEWCCGYPLLAAGLSSKTVDLALHNLEAVQKTEAKTLLTGCPSCYKMWSADYPVLLGKKFDFGILHSTAWLETLVMEKRLQLKRLDLKVTYHDPCDLGRGSGIYEAPRNVLRAIPGLNLVEMQHNREYALCCGGGGDVEMMDASLTEAVAQRRMEEAVSTGAEIIVTSCQQCVRTLTKAAKSSKSGVRVIDITSLVAKQLL